MDYVVAFLNQDTCKVYPHKLAAPAESMVFENSTELARVLTTQQSDDIRRKLLGVQVEHSPSRDVAAARLWHVLTMGADCKTVDWSSRGYVKRKDSFGNDKISNNAPFELIKLTFVKGKSGIVDVFYKKLALQARKIVDMLIEDGRGIWTAEQADAIVVARQVELDSVQDPLAIFHYYRGNLCMKKIIKRVSFAEFAASEEFSEISLIDLEQSDQPTQPPVPEGQES